MLVNGHVQHFLGKANSTFLLHWDPVLTKSGIKKKTQRILEEGQKNGRGGFLIKPKEDLPNKRNCPAPGWVRKTHLKANTCKKGQGILKGPF